MDIKGPKDWDLARWLRFIAGSVLLLVTVIGILPAKDVHWFWKFFLIFMALNQIQSAFTDWCPVTDILRALKIKECKC
ncbi:MAG: DUF2892 domain-containing protein [Aquificae bacterium]|nr:DUF2892 domain-containing protein [Aquificota bacterium]